MIPGEIVKQAKSRGLDFIGISDHNSMENVFAVQSKGRESGIAVIGGIEITSHEEAHILAFFDDDKALLKIQEIIYKNLPDEKNNETLFGEQIIVDKLDNPLGINTKLLIGATKLSIENLVHTIHNLGGIAIASHIDRPAFSIVGQLGFIPEGLELDAVELSPNYSKDTFNVPENFAKVFFSDAHRIEDIGIARTSFFIEKPNVTELKKAMLNQEGRKIL